MVQSYLQIFYEKEIYVCKIFINFCFPKNSQAETHLWKVTYNSGTLQIY